MSGLSDREQIIEYVAEWRTTCQQMDVAYTPESIAEWLTDSAGLIERLKADAVAVERERLLAPLTWQERNKIGCYCPMDSYHRAACWVPNVETVLVERAR